MEEEKKDNNKAFKIFIIIFIILSMFLFQGGNGEKLMGIINSIGNKGKALTLIESFPRGDLLDVNIYDNTIVKWQRNKLSFLNIDGEKIVDKDFNFDDPDIYFGEDMIYPMDKSTGHIYYLDKKGETIDRLELDRQIFNFQAIDGNVIYHEKSSNVENINILNKDKVKIGNYSYEGENVLTYATNKKATKNALALIDINQEPIKTRIDLYGKKDEILYSVDIDGEVVVYLTFTSKDEIVALTDSGIHFIKNGEKIWTKDLSLIKDIYVNEEAIYVLYSNYLELIDFKGNTKEKIGFIEEYKKILPFRNDIIIYGSGHMVMVQGKREVLKQEMEIENLYTSKEKILILGPEELKIYEVISK